MSMDVRYCIKSPKDAEPSKMKAKPVLPNIVLSSDEEDREIKSPKKKPKASKKSNGQHALNDSDDEAPIAKKKINKVEEKKLKPVAIDDVFESKGITRERPAAVASKEHEKNVNPTDCFLENCAFREAEFHDDDEFEATWNQSDSSWLESQFQSVPLDDTSDGKRKRSADSEERVWTKILRRDESSDENKSPKSKAIDEESSKREKSSASGKTDVKDESLESDKPRFTQIGKNKRADIVMETKSNDKNEKAEKEEAADRYADEMKKKETRAMLYDKYLQRGGARNPGSKPIPTGADNCLAGLTFLITGVLESLERDEADELIKKYGGRVVAAVSRKTDYLVVGDDAGPSKLAKATNLGIKQISEDELLDLIGTRPAAKAKDTLPPVEARSYSSNRKISPSPDRLPTSPSPKLTELAPEVKDTSSAGTLENTKPLPSAKVFSTLDVVRRLFDECLVRCMLLCKRCTTQIAPNAALSKQSDLSETQILRSTQPQIADPVFQPQPTTGLTDDHIDKLDNPTSDSERDDRTTIDKLPGSSRVDNCEKSTQTKRTTAIEYARKWRAGLTNNGCKKKATQGLWFTETEQKKMVKFLCEYPDILEAQPKGYHIWKKFIDRERITDRTPQSLQNHFSKVLLPRIDKFFNCMSEHHQKQFQELRDNGSRRKT